MLLVEPEKVLERGRFALATGFQEVGEHLLDRVVLADRPQMGHIADLPIKSRRSIPQHPLRHPLAS